MEGPDAYPEIDWKRYRGMGNFLRHSYHRVSDEIVWNTVKDDLPLLKRIVVKALVPRTVTADEGRYSLRSRGPTGGEAKPV